MQEATPDENGRRLQDGDVTPSDGDSIQTGEDSQPESEGDQETTVSPDVSNEEEDELRDQIDEIVGEALVENPEDLTTEELLEATSQALIDL